MFCFREIYRLWPLFFIAVGIEVAVSVDPHRSIRKCFKRISLEERVSSWLHEVKSELIGERSTDCIAMW